MRRLPAPLAIALAAVMLATAAPATAEEEGRGWEWVASNPMQVSALVVSMGAPPAGQLADYFGDFGATTVSLWLDGAGEAAAWQGRPFTIWLDDSGASLEWDGSAWVSTGELLGGLAPAAPGRIGYQVGDEPLTVAALDRMAGGIVAVRAADPDALVFTNFSYYTSQREAILDRWVALADGDVQSTSDYFLHGLHYTVLERFRASAQAKGVPYWQYLNAYIGSESTFARIHTPSDLRWQALAGLTYGYTGHTWFLYQVADSGRHPTAATWGGSALHDGVGDWTAPRTALWDAVAAINRELRHLGRTITQLRSTDVRLEPAPGQEQPFRTRRWSPGPDPYLVAVGPAAGQPPMDVLVGHFAGPEGDPYVMVQNARHTHSAGAAADSLPGADEPGLVRLEFDFAAAPAAVDRTAIEYMNATTGEIGRLPLTQLAPPPPPPPPPGEDPPVPPVSTRYAVEHVVAPGGVLLFKYANTIPFRLGRRAVSVGVVDPAQGRWHLRDGLATISFYFGNPGDVPFMGDWDCDGIDTPGLYRQSDGFVYLRNSNSVGIADVEFFAGDPSDVPLAGDFDGDGCDTVSLYRPAEGRFYVFNRLGSRAGGLGAADFPMAFGDGGEVPLVGDWDGDGIDTFGLHRRETGQVFLRNALTAGAADVTVVYGDPGDEVVTGDWDGDGATTLGLYRRPESRFYLRGANSAGPADWAFTYGDPGFVAVAGAIN